MMSSEKVAELNIFFNEVLSRSPREVGNDCDEELTRVRKKKPKPCVIPEVKNKCDIGPRSQD